MTTAPQPAPDMAPEPRPRPESPFDLFLSFTLLALQGFGGVLAVVQRELVEKKRWMTRDEFIEDWAVAQILPGPNVVNLSIMLGDRYFGVRGSLAALAGMLTFPLCVVLVLAIVYAQYAGHPAVTGALRGMSAVAAGLIIATGLKLLPALKANPMGPGACAILAVLCFAGIALLRLPLAWVLVVLGGAGMAFAYYRLAPKRAAP